MTGFPVVPVLIALALGLHGLRKRSLSPSGAIAAFVVGSLMLAVPLRTFGISLIAFYLIGSRATKTGKELKAKLEEGHQEAGYRTAFQVLCNSFSAFIAAVLWSGLFIPGSLAGPTASSLFGSGPFPYASDAWCPLSPAVLDGWSRSLVFAALGHFACCLGDTLASELGILSPSPPILITTLKTVPPGTNGGISLVGTLASAAGGILMGIVMSITLAIENAVCRADILNVAISLVLWGGFAGLFGSLIDSLLGATVQRTRFSSSSKLILTDSSPTNNNADVKVVSGLDILTNNQVNLLSSVITSVLLAHLALP